MPRAAGTPKTGGRAKGTPNKVGADLRAIAQQYTEEAVRALVRGLRDPQQCVQAARILLAYGHGPPKQQIEVGIKPLYAISDKPMTAEEWTQAFAAESNPSGLPSPGPRRRSSTAR